MSHKVRELAPNDLLLSHALNLPSICHTGFYRFIGNVWVVKKYHHALGYFMDLLLKMFSNSTNRYPLYLNIFKILVYIFGWRIICLFKLQPIFILEMPGLFVILFSLLFEEFFVWGNLNFGSVWSAHCFVLLKYVLLLFQYRSIFHGVK